MKHLILGLLLLSVESMANEDAFDKLTGNWLLELCKKQQAIGLGCDLHIYNSAQSFSAGYISGLRAGVAAGITLTTNKPAEAEELANSLITEPTFVYTLANSCEQGKPGTQIIAVVKKFLNDHPEKLHEYYPLLIAQAMKEAFPPPCKLD